VLSRADGPATAFASSLKSNWACKRSIPCAQGPAFAADPHAANTITHITSARRMLKTVLRKMRAQRSRPYHQLIPVTAVQVVVRIASNGPRNDHGRNRSVHRKPLPRETAMGQRQPMACETAAAKTVTSASKWPAPPPHARTRLCRLAVVVMPRTIAIAAAITC